MARGRPRRGEPGPNVIVSGDTGEYHPQGGARTGADVYRESGDLDAREFGVPQADLPGGIRHMVNPETHAHKPAPGPERPADYHKYHGVPSDDGQYEPTPDETTLDTPPPDPEPKTTDAVPVYIVEGGGKQRVIRALITEGPVAIPVQSMRRENCQSPQPISSTDRTRWLRMYLARNSRYRMVLAGLDPDPDP